MVFNKGMIIRCETMNRCETFVSFRNIKNIIKSEILFWGANKTSTNLTDSHTCAVCSVDLVVAMVLVSHGELIKFTRDMVSCAGVGVLVGVDPVRRRRCRSRLLLLPGEGGVKTLEAARHRVSLSATELADDGITIGVGLSWAPLVAVVVAATASTAASHTAALEAAAAPWTGGGVDG